MLERFKIRYKPAFQDPPARPVVIVKSQLIHLDNDLVAKEIELMMHHDQLYQDMLSSDCTKDHSWRVQR